MSDERAGSPPAAPNMGENGARWRRNVALIVFGGGAAYFLLTEHLAHTIQALPWVIVLLCPLMHVFMHRGHGGTLGGKGGSHGQHGDGSQGGRR